jgi:hypothetical protein
MYVCVYVYTHTHTHTHMRKVFGDCLLEGQRIVLKCIRKRSSPAENRIVFREIDIHGSLVHPNIAACHGFYEDARFVMMLLDFIEGQVSVVD